MKRQVAVVQQAQKDIDEEAPITFLVAQDVHGIQVADSGITAEQDTFDQGTGDSDTI